MKISFTTKLRRRVPLGQAAKAVIGAAVAPLPEGVKRRIRSCGGCAQRAARLDKVVPNLNPFAAKAANNQPPPP